MHRFLRHLKIDININCEAKDCAALGIIQHSIKVWSPLANTEVRIKLEEIGNAGNNVEKFITTTVTNGWEELTFPFTNADSV